MCGDLCPKSAIFFENESDGFWSPAIDGEKCVNCGVCSARCPVLNETINKHATTPRVYAAWNKNESIRLKSSSGGIYYALAEAVLKKEGYIAGCVFSDDCRSVFHIAGNAYEELNKIIRSKYLQSDTAGIYRKVQVILDGGEKVLFCGTPCQNAALFEFLKKDYDNLIQCDFICHGVNSPKAHQAHINELEKKYGSEAVFFNFRDKGRGWEMLGTLVEFKNGKSSFTHRYNSAWWRGYLGSNLYLRRSCERCRFKKIPRISDISLGDFWGLSSTAENMEKGLSVVMVNTGKGTDFYAEALPFLHSESQTIEKAISGNSCILRSVKINHEKRDEFFRRIENEEFSKVVFDLEGTIYFQMLKRMIKKWLGYFLEAK